MKRKLFCVSLLVIFLSLSAYGTLAFFTTEEKTRNIITTGEIRMQILEWADEEKETPFPGEGVFLVVPGTAVTKIVEAKNTGTGPAFVRIFVEKEIRPAEGVSITPDTDLLHLDINETDWQKQPDGYYYYLRKLEPGETTNPLFHTVTFDTAMGNEYQESTAVIDITLQAVQAQNNGTDPLTAGGWPER